MVSHGEFLREQFGDDPTVVTQVLKDYHTAPLDAADQAMLDFASKVTLDPTSIRKEDTDVLRAHGFTDENILDITVLAAFFNYMTRVADALGVEVEEYRKPWREFLLGPAS